MMHDVSAMGHAQTAPGLHLSLSEIGALSLRAIRGAGRSWGEAEEGAEAACWLARAGLDWATALIGVLSIPATSPHCPLRAGMAIADFSGLPESSSHCEQMLPDLHHPGFLLPFAARTAAWSRQTLRLTWDGATAILVPGETPALAGDFNATGPLTVRLGPHRATETARSRWPRAHSGTIDSGQYATLTALMLCITVPSSAESLAGAGARGSDND